MVVWLSMRAQKGGLGLKKVVMSLAAWISNSISRSGKLMPPSVRGRVAVMSVGGCELELCHISCISRDLICFLNGQVGGAMEAWYHILDRTRDLATRTLPRKDKERVARDLVRGVILVMRDCPERCNIGGSEWEDDAKCVDGA